MEQKTEASQAVDDQAVSVEVYSNAVWLTNGMQVFRLAYTGESDVDRNWYAGQLRAALKAQPAPTEAQGDPVADFIKWLEGRGGLGPGALSERIFIAGWYAGKRAAQGNTSNNSSSSQLSGNSGELANKQVLENIEQVQGEDSARLKQIIDFGCYITGFPSQTDRMDEEALRRFVADAWKCFEPQPQEQS